MEQYEKVCKDRFIKIENQTDRIETVVNQMNATLNNGVKEKSMENNERIKALDNRLWVLMSGVFLSIALQVLFQVVL